MGHGLNFFIFPVHLQLLAENHLKNRLENRLKYHLKYKYYYEHGVVQLCPGRQPTTRGC